ncbi:alkyl hydroperoxide reductase subunit F [Moraxella catarrhalis]|uniref:alkyl hydroperoxide reductase subunit F n=1 Tax=Moraxella catarrhalis TaxID=480 RepID=UPI0007E48ECD|nr:alkyl hydroperoxide reductase subunit F [Moraxella catarrhalis]OAV04758.1 Alkyl hydroperoxide reductase protein F [Moraxella catarrhalis]OAV16450.1 Alkyl hydroperoxide reductase protein F [Moraxella catarrhalis]OAV16649.1 Alkyl hydroperoxide reductase protein F [Moraxella catarrhalis]
MLDQNLLDAVKSYSANMTRPIQLVIGAGEHEKRAELIDFLTKIASTTDKIQFDAQVIDNRLSPMSFKITTQNRDTGIVFSGIPGGHEFTSLILAILQAGGHTLKLDEDIQQLVKHIQEPLKFQTFVSLSCHNCPDVVQALNQFAILNDHIANEMIDGGVFPELVAEKKIQGVPAVFLNGKPFANGKVDTAKLIEKLQEQYPNLLASANETQLETQDVTVIGGGPAGTAAAIYTARKGLRVAIVADRIGGQVKDTQDIENLISIPLTNGNTLAANLATHIKEYNITVKEHVSVSKLEEVDGGYQVTLSTGVSWLSRTVILATGAKWRKLGVKGEDENIGNGVAYCPHCDGPFFKGKDVAVIGGGNSGVEAALDLAGIVNHVTVLEFGDSLRADQVLIDKAEARENITIIKSAATTEITTDGSKVNALIYQDRVSGNSQTLPLSAVFVQIGLVPNSEIAKGLVTMTPQGEIEIDAKCRTSKAGIFACGDVTTVPYKQINIAMGEGSKAGLSAFEYLMMNG